jgi:sulfite reductase alpha subunit-like flavoprotein
MDHHPPPDRSALVLYGSETGSAEDVALELAQLCERLRFATRVCSLNSIRLVCGNTAPSLINLSC